MQTAKSWLSRASSCREKPGLPAVSGSPEASKCPMARVSCDGSETEGGSHVAQILPLFPGAAEKGAEPEAWPEGLGGSGAPGGP